MKVAERAFAKAIETVSRSGTETAENGVWASSDDGKYDLETAGIKEQIENSHDKLNNMDVAGSATVPENLGKDYDAKKWIMESLKSTGYQVERNGFGKISFNSDDISHGLTYANTKEEKAAFALIPKVLKRGIEIGEHENHKGRGKRKVTFAAPVELNGIRGNMAVTVKLSGGNHYDAHRIVFPDGSAFTFAQKKETDARTANRADTALNFPITSVSDTRVP